MMDMGDTDTMTFDTSSSPLPPSPSSPPDTFPSPFLTPFHLSHVGILDTRHSLIGLHSIANYLFNFNFMELYL